MRVAYFADDGTEFGSEYACKKYEQSLNDLRQENLNNGFHAYDDDGDEIDFGKCNFEDLEDMFQDVSYVEFDSEKAIEIFLTQARRYGLCELDEDLRRPLVVGERYFYDWDKDEWACLEDRQKALDKIADVFK